jgi:stress response protein YsnF
MLKLGGLMVDGQNRHAIVSGVSFAEGETKTVPLQNRTVQVTCAQILRTEVILKVAGLTAPVSLKIGGEKYVP